MSRTEEQLKRRLSGVIKGKDAEQFSSWQPPAMVGHTVNKDTITPGEASLSASGSSPATAESLENVTQNAYDEGFQKGLKAGQEEGLRQQQEKIEQLQSVINDLVARTEQFDDQITKQLAELTTEIAQQVIRKELTLSSDAILTLVQEVLAMMPTGSDKMTLKLNPADASMVIEAYQLDQATDLGWKIIEDSAIQQGGCVLTSDISTINAEVEQRIESVINQLLGPSDDD